MANLRDDQVRRYARHILLPDVGGVGQQRLLAATARLGDLAGGGGAALVYLAAAGVGTLVVEDEALVGAEDVGVLFELADVGRPRREAARARVAALNPDASVAEHGAGPVVIVGPGEPLLAGALAAEAWIREVAGR